MDLTTQTTETLKAMAYDKIAIMEETAKDLRDINAEILKRQQVEKK